MQQFRMRAALACLLAIIIHACAPLAASAQEWRLDVSAFANAREGELIVRYADGSRDRLTFGSNEAAALAWRELRDRADVYAVQLTGNEREKKRYSVYLDQQTLVVEYNDKRNFFWKRDLFDDDKVKITITLPHLEELKIKGAGELKVLGFDEQDIEIKLAGAIEGDGDFRAENLTLELTGASIMELRGRGNFLEANLTGACGLRAYNYEVSQAIVEAHGASSAKVFVTDRLEIDKGVASSVSHRGDPEVINRN